MCWPLWSGQAALLGVLATSVSMLLCVALVAGALWALIRWLSRTPQVVTSTAAASQLIPTPAASPSPLEVLRARFVRGEIDLQTFDEMLGRLLRSERDGERT